MITYLQRCSRSGCGVLSLRTSIGLAPLPRWRPPLRATPPLFSVTGIGGGEAVTDGRMAERSGTGAFAPERPRRGEACCLSPQGELHASSAGADMLRSSAQLATVRHRLTTALARFQTAPYGTQVTQEANQ